MKFHWSGFTLVEVMVVAVIIAVLAGLAYPSYRDAVRKARRAEGRAALLQVLQQQERYYLLHTRYIAFSADSADADAKKFNWHSGNSAAASAYEISGAACAGATLQDCILLSATPGSAKVDSAYEDPHCGVLSLSSTGAKLPAGKDCW
ncbi:type IV pilin protein [Noviherbaspirillum sedimenti]|nr:type IV pilin protein [Noviherbaspirillum sedimenti]